MLILDREKVDKGGGPGTGKAVLYTPGNGIRSSWSRLKVRDAGDITQLPAKIIKCLQER